MAEGIFSIECNELPDGAHVVAFRGEEALGRLYRFEIGLMLTGGKEIDLDAAANARAKLSIVTGVDSPNQVVHGILAAVELVHAWQGQVLYRAVLVPELWQLTLTHHSRVFVEQSTPDIIEQVLQDSGISSDSYELKLDASYDPHLHVTQYHESNFAFLARWMEREGMYFYFEQGDDAEKLIITDCLSYHDKLVDQAVRYVPASGEDDVMGNEALDSFACRRNMLPAEVAVSDYDYVNPSLALEGTAPVDGVGNIVLHGENFRTNADGKRIATVRAEAFLCRRKVHVGHGRIFNLRAGYTFALEEHPLSSMNESYLVTELRHQGNQSANSKQVKRMLGIDSDDEYKIDLVAIRDDVQFRPQRLTPVPRIDGVLSALVDGPADSQYSQIDEHGRYKIKLMLDESDLSDGGASLWARMLQIHGGGTEGVHFPLRKGTEVLVIFLGGDPDRPMIAGAGPNTHKPAPVTQSNHTLNILVSGGYNYLAMQDEDGAQWIDLSTPPQNTWMHLGEPHSDDMGTHTHYIVLNTDGDCFFNIGSNQDIEIGGDLYEHVVGDVTELYDSDQDTEVAGDETLEVGGDRDMEIAGDQTLEIGGDNDIEIAGDQTYEVGGDRDIEVGGDMTYEVTGDWDVEIGGDNTLEVTGDCDVEIGGDHTLEVTGDVEITVSGNWQDTITGSYKHTVLSDCTWLNIGAKAEIAISANAAIKLSADAELSIGAKLSLAASISAELKASLALEAVMGVKIECDMAAKVNIEAGASIKTKTAEIVGRGIIKMDNTAGLRMLSQSLVLVA